MYELKKFTKKDLKTNPEQIQIFTPTPSTYATLTYYTELDPFTLKPVFVEKNMNKKIRQKEIMFDNSLKKQTKKENFLKNKKFKKNMNKKK